MRHRPTSTAYCIAVLRSSSYVVVHRILKRVMQSADTNLSNLYVYIIKLLINTVLLVTVGVYFVFYIIFTWSAVVLYWSAVICGVLRYSGRPQNSLLTLNSWKPPIIPAPSQFSVSFVPCCILKVIYLKKCTIVQTFDTDYMCSKLLLKLHRDREVFQCICQLIQSI